ncbi:MAG: twin-arginine translocase subunit TatB [Myxococcales bacterium]|nr:twin-arginine translocase subunit TatB [Myxococcales bacterium]
MFGMGFGELVVLVIVAIVVVGPKDLPKMLRKLGQWSGKIRRMAGDLRAQSGIDDVLHAEGLGQDIAEIRKLARGELDSVARSMRLDDQPGAGSGAAPPASHDADLTSGYVAEEREHPQVGPDGFDAMPDTSFVYGGSFPRSALDRDPLYRTGAVDGVVPDDPPEPEDTSGLDTDVATAPEPTATSPSAPGATSPSPAVAAPVTAVTDATSQSPATEAPGTGAP